jgi:hypothetical protein
MTKYIFDMDKEFACLCLDESGNWCNFIKKKCSGSLDDRPDWCYLTEVGKLLNDVLVVSQEESGKKIAEIANKILKYYAANPEAINNLPIDDFDVDKSLKIALDDNGWDK